MEGKDEGECQDRVGDGNQKWKDGVFGTGDEGLDVGHGDQKKEGKGWEEV